MNDYERMEDLISREIASTSPEEWTDADILVRIREIEENDRQQAEREGGELREPLSIAECERIVNRILHPDWGGPRAGGGRPTICGERLVSISVTLPQEAIADLAQLGGGNVSRGVRRMWEIWLGAQ